jgi:hypothetical protein
MFVEYMISERMLTPTYRAADPLGAPLFGELRANALRWNVLRVILEARLTTSEFSVIKPHFNALGKTLRSAAALRNELVHSMYGIEVEYDEGRQLVSDEGDNLIKTKPHSLTSALKPHDLINHYYLEEVIETLRRACNELESFADDVKGRIRDYSG